MASSAFYYVYMTKHLPTGKYYIGCRKSQDPEADTKYFGSGVWRLDFPLSRLRREATKHILAIFTNLHTARLFEKFLILDHRRDAKCMNELGHNRRRLKIRKRHLHIRRLLQAGKSVDQIFSSEKMSLGYSYGSIYQLQRKIALGVPAIHEQEFGSDERPAENGPQLAFTNA
jgi:hypothetical protein